jgi:hypothetical protein
MAASVEIVSLATARYRMQAMSKIGKMTGFDGRHEWIRDEAFDDICDRFRNAILNKNYIVAIDMLCEIMTASLHRRFVNFFDLVSLDTTS